MYLIITFSKFNKDCLGIKLKVWTVFLKPMQLPLLLSTLLSGGVPTEKVAFSGAQEHRWKWLS